jgi:hypothetical protein
VASEALKRKRQRDKESQRRKRLRERQYTTTLEKRIAQLENQLAATTGLPEHPTGQPTTPQCCSIGFDYYDSRGQIRISPEEAVFPSASLAQVSPGLTLVDEISASAATPSQVLPSTSPQVLFTPQSLDVETPPSSDNVPPGRSNSSPEAQITANTTPSTQGQDISVPLSLFESVLRTPEWMRIPNLNFSQISSARPWIRGDRLGPFVRRIRSDPEAEALCPPQPKTIDILFGGSKNVLANLIAGEVAKEALLPPEKFAISWMLYLYVKVWCFSIVHGK